MSNTRYDYNMHIAAARRQAQASEDLLARIFAIKPRTLEPRDADEWPLLEEPSPTVGLASEDPAEDTSRGGPCLTQNDEETP